MTEFDCRGWTVARTGTELIAHYNASKPGARYTALVDDWGPSLRMWLLEAGARHDVSPCHEGLRVTIERSASPAQGTIPGVHHIVRHGGDVWTSERGARVARISAGENAVVACVSIAKKASHLALSADGTMLVVADPGAGKVLALDAASLEVKDCWDAPGMPQLPLVSPEAIVCATGGGTGTFTIARPTPSGYRAQTIPVGRAPHDPLLSRDGLHVWVPCAGSAEAVKVRLSDGAVVGRCAVGEGPAHLASDPHTGRIYSANSWDGTVSCITDDGELVATVHSGRWCHAIDITPDGKRLWVANFYDDTLSVFDTETMARVALLPSERYAHGLDVSPDGRWVVATGFSSDHVQVYDARRCELIARIEVGRGSSHTAFAGDGASAHVGCSVSAHVAVLDLDRAVCRGRVTLPGEG
ncbi:MAG: beta-propeller fold lactonase family protein [Rhodospirillaceae bacterium]